MTWIVLLFLLFGVICGVWILRSATRKRSLSGSRHACPRCGAISPSKARFCAACGSPLP